MKFKFRIPFIKPKKSTAVALTHDEELYIAKEKIAEYPLLQSSTHISKLLENKFITEKGIRLHPNKFLAEVITYIEKTEPETKEEFALYIQQKIANLVIAPLPKRKLDIFKLLNKNKVD
jgi:hypothetical protein